MTVQVEQIKVGDYLTFRVNDDGRVIVGLEDIDRNTVISTDVNPYDLAQAIAILEVLITGA